MRRLVISCCAAAIAISAASFFTPTPAQAWGYRHYGYFHRPYAFAYVYRPHFYAYRRFYRPHFYAYRPFYRPYAYAYRPFYRPYAYAYRPFYRPYFAYRPYRAYAYAGFAPRIWIGWGRHRWR
jgi:hypothetical protein